MAWEGMDRLSSGVDDEMATIKESSERPLGADLHEAISEIGDIDNEIMRLQKRRLAVSKRIEVSLNDISRRFSDTYNQAIPSPTDGRY